MYSLKGERTGEGEPLNRDARQNGYSTQRRENLNCSINNIDKMFSYRSAMTLCMHTVDLTLSVTVGFQDFGGITPQGSIKKVLGPPWLNLRVDSSLDLGISGRMAIFGHMTSRA